MTNFKWKKFSFVDNSSYIVYTDKEYKNQTFITAYLGCIACPPKVLLSDGFN